MRLQLGESSLIAVGSQGILLMRARASSAVMCANLRLGSLVSQQCPVAWAIEGDSLHTRIRSRSEEKEVEAPELRFVLVKNSAGKVRDSVLSCHVERVVKPSSIAMRFTSNQSFKGELCPLHDCAVC